MADSLDDLFQSYVRSLRWQVPLTLVAVVALWGFGLVALVTG